MNAEENHQEVSRVELEAILYEQEHRIFRLWNNYFRVRSRFEPNDPRHKAISEAFWMRLLWQFLFRSAVPVLASGATIAGLIGLYLSYHANSLSRDANNVANEANQFAVDANNIANEANSISARLLEFEQLNPTFVFKKLVGRQLEGVFNPDLYSGDGEAIVIENEGNTIRSAEANIVVFLKLRITERYQAPKSISLPLLSVYFIQSKSADNKTFYMLAPHLWRKMHDLQVELAKLAKTKKAFVEIDLDRYVDITFADREGEFRNEYYQITPVRGAVLLPLETGQAIFKDHEERILQEGKLLVFDRLTTDVLWSHVKKCIASKDN